MRNKWGSDTNNGDPGVSLGFTPSRIQPLHGTCAVSLELEKGVIRVQGRNFLNFKTVRKFAKGEATEARNFKFGRPISIR